MTLGSGGTVTLGSGGTVTLGTARDFPGLDPMLTTLFNANNLHTLIWQSLTRFDANMDVQPDLASIQPFEERRNSLEKRVR